MAVEVTAPDLAEVAGISRQASHKIARQFLLGRVKPWQGSVLVVREGSGSGGRSGQVLLIEVKSLPTALQAALKAPKKAVQLALKLDDVEASARNMRFHIIGPVLKTEPGTPERAAATKARAAETFHLGGKVFPASERSIQRWAEKHEAEGFAGLTRKKRKDAGARSAIVTDAWDRAVKLPEAPARAIAAELERYIGGLVKAGESPSIITHHAQRHLLEITRKAGCDLPTEALLAACAVPTHIIRRARDLRKVHRFDTDRKAHEDILRCWRRSTAIRSRPRRAAALCQRGSQIRPSGPRHRAPPRPRADGAVVPWAGSRPAARR